MAGPTPMTLGPYAFEALGFGFTDLTRHLETPWASVDVCARLDALHWTGPKAETVTIKGVLFPLEFGGLDTLESIRNAAKRGAVLPLITADGRVYGRYVVEDVNEDQSLHDGSGIPRKDSYSIKLKRIEATSLGGLFAGFSI